MLNLEEWNAVRITLLVAFAAVAISLPVAVVVGWVMAKKHFWGKALLEIVVNLPLVIPPVVTGYLLIIVFGRHGLLGAWIETWLGVRMIFDWKGAVLAAAVVSFPLLVRPIRLAFSQVDDRLIQAARSLGASRLDCFVTVVLPMARNGICAGCTLAFARSMGEFGATIMLAGNIPGETQTMSLLIYTLLESPDGQRMAWRLVCISVAIAAMALWLSERWLGASKSDRKGIDR